MGFREYFKEVQKGIFKNRRVSDPSETKKVFSKTLSDIGNLSENA
jgi:hypothetical protein